MQNASSRFLKQVSAGVLSVLIAAHAISLSLRFWVEARILASESDIQRAMQSGVQLLDSADSSASFASISSLLDNTRNQLREKALTTGRIRSAAERVNAITFLQRRITPLTSQSGGVLVTAMETFAWLASASPAIERVAGYDAAQDTAQSRDDTDLYRRLYSAYLGLNAAQEQLSGATAVLPTNDIAILRAQIRETSNAAATVIRAIDNDEPFQSTLMTFISLSAETTRSAAELKERLSGEPFRKELSAILQ